MYGSKVYGRSKYGAPEKIILFPENFFCKDTDINCESNEWTSDQR